MIDLVRFRYMTELVAEKANKKVTVNLGTFLIRFRLWYWDDPPPPTTCHERLSLLEKQIKAKEWLRKRYPRVGQSAAILQFEPAFLRRQAE